jgi:hypothetical protein
MAIFQNKVYKDQLLAVDHELVGIKDRGVEPHTPNNAEISGTVVNFHPMVRDNWGTIDPIRGLMGSYYTRYQGSKGQTLYSYAGALKRLKEGEFPGAFDSGGNGIGSLRKQLTPAQGGGNSNTNIVLTINQNITYENSIRFIRDLGAKNAWNSYENSEPYAWFRDKFEDYIAGSIEIEDRIDQSSISYPGLLTNFDQTYLDHTSNHYLFSSNKQIAAESGLLTTVEPVYNFYVNSNPDYEDVIADPRIQEFLIPNAYYLQLELQNTSSEFLAPFHRTAITMGEKIPWFIQSIVNSAIERDSGVYYNLYSDRISVAINTLPEVIKEKIKDVNNNIAVLSSDLAVLNSDSIIEETLPFYNKITIGYDADRRTGDIATGISFLQRLLINENTRDFVDILQTYAIIKYREHNVEGPQRLFSTRQKKVTNSETGDFENSSENLNIPILFGIDPTDPTPFTTTEQLEGIEQGPNNLSSLKDVKFLRDYFGKMGEGELEIQTESALYAYGFLFDENGNPTENLLDFKRSVLDIYENRICETETLMYIIEKHRVPSFAPAGLPTIGGLETQPVQTFFISPKYSDFVRDTVFYDSQIKYNQNYRYIFKKIVLVFGNEYKYNNVNFLFNSAGTIATSFDLEYENNLSIKAIVVPYNFDGITVSVIDKPPVSPEISFYPLKGINNKVKILLNSSTGDYFDKPVVIQQSDKEFFEEEYFGQFNEDLTYADIVEQEKKIQFKTDDFVNKYHLFRLTSPPKSYLDFQNTLIEIDPPIGVPGYYEDIILPNRKYYYCVRSVDVHNNISNPTYIFEIEMVDNNGQIYLKQNVFTYKSNKPAYIKNGRKFIYIEPSLQQSSFGDSTVAAPASVDELPEDSLLGVEGISKVWTKEYKIRITSKKTGKKMDLNITFKNSGITNSG